MGQINAKEELQRALIAIDNIDVKCANVWRDRKVSILKTNNTKEDRIKFFTSLDYEYDNGWGGQELYGTVWLADGTWLSRGEYDGSEWWQHNRVPEIPKELIIRKK